MPAPKYIAFCYKCYSCYLTKPVAKRVAEKAAVSHMKAYKHETGINLAEGMPK